MGPVKSGELEWAVASRPAAPEAELGDGYLVVPHEQGALLAVVDGLGTGPEVAIATRSVLAAIERVARDPLPRICLEAHDAGHASRGVVLGLARVDTGAGELTWLGVGGVRGLVRRAESPAPLLSGLHTHNGIVGRYLPPLRPHVEPFGPGGLLFIATDGIRPGFEKGVAMGEPPQRIAVAILAHHAVPGDDALVLVAGRVRGLA